MSTLISISPKMLVPMDLFTGTFPLAIDIAYKKPEPENIFGVLYRPEARLWLHEDLAKIVLLAAKIVEKSGGFRLILYDGLRTVEAQEAMGDCPYIWQNPHLREGLQRMVSPPGMGAHPRGMAIDLSLLTPDGKPSDMGTAFDAMADDPGPAANPAHREYPHSSAEARRNRNILTGAMTEAARRLGLSLLPLPQEWWDFRFPPKIYERYAPFSDRDLPAVMQMTDVTDIEDDRDIPEPEESHFEALKEKITAEITEIFVRA